MIANSQGYRVIIPTSSERSAMHIKEQIEKYLPFLDGMVTIVKEPEVKPLDEVIVDYKGGMRRY